MLLLVTKAQNVCGGGTAKPHECLVPVICFWAAGKSEDCVSRGQVTQTNSFHPVLAPAQPDGEDAHSHTFGYSGSVKEP